MPRLSRNTATAVSNENKILNDKKQNKKSSIPVATKRQIAEKIQNYTKPKRKVFGDITNTASENNQDSGKQEIKSQVKKSFNSLVEKRKTLIRKNAKKEQNKPSLSNSSSLKGALVCVTEVKELEITKPIVCPDPPRACPPEGVEDFDGEHLGDPMQHSEYAMDTFQYYKIREDVFLVGDYMYKQKKINKYMRAVLVNWLVEVQECFELSHETLYTAVKATDIYLSKSKTQAKKEHLQLIGVTACFIACKFADQMPPLLDELVDACDHQYCRDQIKKMERQMLQVIGFDVGYPLSYSYIRRYGRVCRLKMPVLTLGRYILETALTEYSLNVNTSESMLAAAAMIVSMKMMSVKGYKATLEYYSGYQLEELSPLVTTLVEMLHWPTSDSCRTVKDKYSSKIFHEVANYKVPDVVDASSDQ